MLLLHRLSIVFVAIFLPVLLMGVAVLSWQMGDRFNAILAIAVIAVIFICWGISHLLTGHECRDMTEDERVEFNRMAMRRGAQLALLFGCLLFASVATVCYTFGEFPIAYVAPLWVGAIIAMPIMYYLRKPIR